MSKTQFVIRSITDIFDAISEKVEKDRFVSSYNVAKNYFNLFEKVWG